LQGQLGLHVLDRQALGINHPAIGLGLGYRQRAEGGGHALELQDYQVAGFEFLEVGVLGGEEAGFGGGDCEEGGGGVGVGDWLVERDCEQGRRGGQEPSLEEQRHLAVARTSPTLPISSSHKPSGALLHTSPQRQQLQQSGCITSLQAPSAVEVDLLGGRAAGHAGEGLGV
jgi:hypothetical protein